MKNLLITLHRWLGFPIGLLFVITFFTGSVTAVDELLQRINDHYDYREYRWQESNAEQQGNTLNSLTADIKNMRLIQMPTHDNPYYKVVSRGENWTYPINFIDANDNANVIHTIVSNDGFFRTILQLHRNFLLGKEGIFGIEGKYITAITGLVALFISLLGLYIWWPKRKTFRTKHIIPQGKERRFLLKSHMTSGVVVLVVIVMLALTGASISYRNFVQQLLGIERDKPPVIQTVQLDDNWQAWLLGAYANMPENAQLDHIRLPRQPRNREQTINNTVNNIIDKPIKNNNGSVIEFRFITENDWFGLAGSKVKINQQSSQIIDVIQFGELPLSEKIYSVLVPLHTGHHLPAIYVTALLLLSSIGSVMVLTGLISFIVKQKNSLKTLSLYKQHYSG